MTRCLTMTLAAVLVAVPAFVGARQSQEGTFHAGTHTVSIYATVLDHTGRLAPDLTKDDFIVFDDGVRQELTVFKNDVQPITVVLMPDRSGSMVGNFGVVRDAAEQFVGDLLPDDKARIRKLRGAHSDRSRAVHE